MIGVGVLALPRIIAEQAGTGAPLAVLFGTIPAILSWWAAVKLFRRFPHRTPVEYAPPLVTRPLGWLYGAALFLFYILLTAMTVREFGEVLKVAVLSKTPLEVAISLLLLTVAYFVRYDVQVVARVFEVFFPLMILPLIVIALLSLKNARAYYLLPPLGDSWTGLLNGAAVAAVGYVSIGVGKFLLPSLNRPNQAMKAGGWALGLSAFVYLLVVTATLAVLGPEEIKRVIWPTYELIKSTTVPGLILERLEAAFIGIWVAAVFTTLGATYYTSLLIVTQLFRLSDHKVMSIPLVPVLYMIAMTPDDIHTLYRFVQVLGLAGVALTMGGTILLAVIGLLRGRGASQDAGAAQ